jgi:uncharacterized membrane protein SpoIIM required for sporulation
MKQQGFENRFAPEWDAFERWLEHRGKREKAGEESLSDSEMPRRYRRICQQLALARDRRYGAAVIERLHQLATRGHHVLYGSRADRKNRFAAFVFDGFPRCVRAERRLVALALALFMGPLAGMIVLTGFFPDSVYYLVSPESIEKLEHMYRADAPRLGRFPEANSAIFKFGVYIRNNIKIAFQTFAGGLLFGVGTLFFLLFNGFFLGAVAGHLTHSGHFVPFYSFVAGHSALELTAIALSGAAGLKLGGALVAPGQLSRKQALVVAARGATGIVYGAAGMLLLAAFVEAFWSPLTEFAPAVKYGAGIALWMLLGAYFLLLGRGRGV